MTRFPKRRPAIYISSILNLAIIIGGNLIIAYLLRPDMQAEKAPVAVQRRCETVRVVAEGKADRVLEDDRHRHRGDRRRQRARSPQRPQRRFVADDADDSRDDKSRDQRRRHQGNIDAPEQLHRRRAIDDCGLVELDRQVVG